MSISLPVDTEPTAATPIEPFVWLGRVLAHFATAERSIGQLCIALDLPVAELKKPDPGPSPG